jgi:hypothetical protein
MMELDFGESQALAARFRPGGKLCGMSSSVNFRSPIAPSQGEVSHTGDSFLRLRVLADWIRFTKAVSEAIALTRERRLADGAGVLLCYLATVISPPGRIFRHRIVRRWLVATLVCGALLAIGTPPTANAQPLVTGVTDVGEEPLAFQQARATGARFVHITIFWANVAPSQEPNSWQPENPADPNYNWAQTDLAVATATQAGLTPVLMVYGAPLWVQGCQPPSAVVVPLCDPNPAALAAFAIAAAHRYSGHFGGLPRVRYWQGLNEPNLSLFFNPQFEGGKPVSPALYRHLINAFYFAVKSVDRSDLVLAAGLGPVAVPGYTVGPMRFARLLLCMAGRRNPHPIKGDCEGGVHFDIFDIHPYTTGGPTHKGHVDDVELGDLGKLQELLKAADHAGRIKGRFRHTPLWITELSWDSKPPDPGGLPMPILKRWTAEALYRAWGAGVSHFFWYGLRDWPRVPNRPFSETIESGLYFRGATVAEDQPKPSMYAFRFPFVAYSRNNGFFFWGRTPTSTPGSVTIQVQEHGQWRDASTTRADADGIFTGEVETTFGRNEHGMVRALYRGEEAVPFSLHPVKDFHQPPFG